MRPGDCRAAEKRDEIAPLQSDHLLVAVTAKSAA
jgi:hypothetical protein